MTDTAPSDLDLVKQGSRWLWSQGDYPAIAAFLEAPALELARRCVSPGMRVLDVAAGNGNFAVAAARLGADVTATDFSPRMVELGRARSAAEGLAVTWLEGDAESLPFADGDFDLAASVFGAIFAPRPDVVASEMFRVVRPGGTVTMATYAGGYFEKLSELIARFSTRSGPSLPSPFEWGDEAEVRRRFAAHAASIDFARGTIRLRFDSFDDWRARFADANPPLQAMKAMLPPPAHQGLIRDAWALAGGSPASDYLLIVATSPRG
jgi:SAM-dependent methyltransferase